MNDELLKRLSDLDDRKKELDSELDTVKGEMEKLKKILYDQFLQSGTQSIKAHGKLFFLYSQLWASSVNGEAAVEELERLGMPDCVMVSTQRLSSVIREATAERFFEINPTLKPLIRVEERGDVRIKKG